MKARRHRHETGQSQAEFAKQAGVPLRTYKRFESQGKANLETFIQVLGAMGRTPYLFMLFPQSMQQAPPTLDEKLRAARLRGLAATSISKR